MCGLFGIMYRSIRKYSHVFGLGDPIDSILSSKEGPIYTSPSLLPPCCCVVSNSINYSSWLYDSSGFLFHSRSNNMLIMEDLGNTGMYLKKKITCVFITPGHLLLSSLYLLPKRRF